MTGAARAATGKPVVAVLMNGRPLAIPWLADSVPAILETWFLGVEHGHAVADVLFGDDNPAAAAGDLSARDRPGADLLQPQAHRPAARRHEKYTSKYIDVPWTPL